MSRKTTPGALIHCEYCGEDYSATYKRCPFCGEKPSPGTEPIPPLQREELDDYVFEGQDLFDAPDEEAAGEDSRVPRTRGGKRLNQEETEAAPVNWPRLITFICSLVMIAAALIIVFAYLYPKIHAPGTTPPTAADPPAVSEQTPASQAPTQPPVDTAPPSDEPTAPPDEPTDEPVQATGKITGVSSALRVRSTPDTDSDNKVTTLKNGAPVTILSDPGNGWYQISCIDDSGKQCEGYVKSEYVKLDPGAVPSAPPAPSNEPGQALSGGLKTGPAKVANASSGLNVRSGPDSEKIGSLHNGDAITIVSDAGNGWFQITYSGSGGKQVTGYVKGEYISQ